MAKSKELTDELKWVEEDAKLWRPPQDEFPVTQRTFSDVLWKATDNFLVPLGLIATTACLTLGIFNMKAGDSQRQQLFMRGRVLFQGLTIGAMTLGIWLQTNRQKRRQPASGEKSE